MAKMGRPKSDNPKDKRINLRLTKEEFDTISYVAESLNLSMSEAIVVTMEERADEIYRIRTTQISEQSKVKQVKATTKQE